MKVYLTEVLDCGEHNTLTIKKGDEENIFTVNINRVDSGDIVYEINGTTEFQLFVGVRFLSRLEKLDLFKIELPYLLGDTDEK